MSRHSIFVGDGIDIMKKFREDISTSESPRVIVPIIHLYLDHIFDLVLAKQWDKSSKTINERSGYNEKLKILYARNLIDDEHFETLKSINTIRNEFAHSFNPRDSNIEKLTLNVKGHGYDPTIPWLDRYRHGALNSMSVLCNLLRDH